MFYCVDRSADVFLLSHLQILNPNNEQVGKTPIEHVVVVERKQHSVSIVIITCTTTSRKGFNIHS